MIDKLIKKYSNDANYRINRVLNHEEVDEKDLILLLRSLTEIIDITTNIRDNFTKTLNKYIVKN